MNKSKFIIVQDVSVAHKLIAAGFKIVSQVNSMYTFMNATPKHFNFEDIDIKKLVYTDRLVF